ncbi:hypothetical protein [Acidovorax sp. LjRoot117]|uniref:hypothetical protein n=1 Tax=Acidovorax sp. LjRoot117 TaxID=3342255 RepID=UPI003ED02E2D
MNANGIEFAHRRPQTKDSALEFAQFTAFAALCAHHGAASAVTAVFYDTKWCGFDIDAAAGVEGGPLHGVIQRCAEQTLPQFILFGTYGEWNRAEPLPAGP